MKNRYLTLALVSAVCVTSVMPTYATTTAVQPAQTVPTAQTVQTTQAIPAVQKVTWQSAYDAAVKNDLSIKLAALDDKKRADDLEDAKLKLRTLITVSDEEVYSATDAITTLNDNQAISLETESMTKATLKDTVLSHFIKVKKAEIQYAAAQLQVSYDDKQIVFDRKRKAQGLITQSTLENLYNQYLSNQKTAKQKANELEKARLSLKELIAADIKSSMVLDTTFIDSYSKILPKYETGEKTMLESSLTIIKLKNAQKRLEDRLALLQQRYPESKSTISSRNSIEDATDAVKKAKLDVDDAISSASYLYSTTYESMVDALSEYNQKKADFAVEQLTFKTAEKQYKLGKTSKQSFLGSEVKFKNADASVKSAWLDYVQTRFDLDAVIAGTKTK